MSFRYLIGLLLLNSLSAQADIYRWVDEQGQVQFSDRPPPRQHAETVEFEPLNQYEPDDAEREGRLLTEERDYWAEEQAHKARRKAQRLAQEKRRKQAQQRAAKCEKARYDLRMFNAKPYGSTSLEAMQRKRQRRSALNDKIKKYCR